MGISGKVLDQVGSGVKVRGAKYFRQGGVRIIQGSGQKVMARVSGTQVYDVLLNACDFDELEFSCTCPYYFSYYEPCKHIWATLLASDQAGHLEALSRSSSIDMVPADDPDDDFLDDDEGDDDEDAFFKDEADDDDFLLGMPGAAARIVKSKGDRRDSERTWHSHLRNIQHGQDLFHSFEKEPLAQNTESELIYVVNRKRTFDKQLLVVELYSRTRKSNGTWGKPRRFNASIPALKEHPDPADR
ncbi:MAG: SWIM zinc finger family protein, partial [Planctomycetota bacterium]